MKLLYIVICNILFIPLALSAQSEMDKKYTEGTRKVLEITYDNSEIKKEVDRRLRIISHDWTPVIFLREHDWLVYVIDSAVNERIIIKIEF